MSICDAEDIRILSCETHCSDNGNAAPTGREIYVAIFFINVAGSFAKVDRLG